MGQQRITGNAGATAQPDFVMTTSSRRSTVSEMDLGGFDLDADLNGPFLADFLSSCVAHERDGLNLYGTLKTMTNNPMLSQTYGEFLADTTQAVGVWEKLIQELGGSHAYASPAGRLTETLDAKVLEAFLLSESADPLVMELKGIEAVLLAATICVSNCGLLYAISDKAENGTAKLAMDQACEALTPFAVGHVEWAKQTQQRMVVAQAESAFKQKAGEVMENVAGKVKDIWR